MPITLVCPACNAKMKAPDNLIGKAVKCPSCSKPVMVKAPGAAAPPAAPPPAPVVKKPVKPPEPILDEEPIEEMDPVEEELDSPRPKKKRGGSADALQGGPSTDTERSTALWIYLTPILLGWCCGIGYFIPLFLWISKRKESAFIDHHGKNWLNLIINSMALSMPLGILAGIGGAVGGSDSYLGLGIMGFFGFLASIVGMYFFVMMIVSGLKAKGGVWYQPKMAFRLLK